MDDSGYAKNVDLWGATDSWAHTIATSPQLVTAGVDNKITKVFQQQFREQVQLLERTFDAVRTFVKSTRRGANAPG